MDVTPVVDRGRAVLERIDQAQQRRPVTAVPVAVVKQFGDDRAGDLAALVAYYSFFSLFPLLLVFVTVAGIVLGDDPELRQRFVTSALGQFPVVGNDLGQNVGAVRGTTTIALVVGIGGALWAGLGATMAMERALAGAWHVPAKRRAGFLPTRLRALAGLAVIGAFVVASTVATGVVAAAGDVPLVGRVPAGIIPLALSVAMYLAAFSFLTGRARVWTAHVPGAIAAGIGWTALQATGTWYLGRMVAGASSTYGTFAVVLGLLTWLYLQAQITMYAVELNVVLAEHRWPRSLVPAPEDVEKEQPGTPGPEVQRAA